MGDDERERQSLEQAVTHIEGETRMLMPGIQGLFGFQLIAVFNQSFWERLASGERCLHLAALLLTAVAIALALAPAAYHRLVEPREVSGAFARRASRLVGSALAPLMLGLSIEVWVLARLILGGPGVATALAAAVLALFAGMWYAWPLAVRRRARER